MPGRLIARPVVPFDQLILFGREWITASFWQDWYGILPLLVGSIMVSIVALVIAVPFGVAAAIYVSEIARPNEKTIHQAVHRIHFRDSVGGARIFRHRGCRRSGSRRFAIALV